MVGVSAGGVLRGTGQRSVTGLLLGIALVLQSPAADSLRLLAEQGPDSALVMAVRTHSLAAREAATAALARRQLEAARRIAAAYGVAWSDSFLVREVLRFESWPQSRQAAKVWADSVRRAGIVAYGRDGAGA